VRNAAAGAIVYSVMPNSKTGSVPDLGAISTIFGAVKAKSGPGNATGGWDHVAERLPSNWFNRPTPFGLAEITAETLKQYAKYPLTFGQNYGVNNFTAIDVPLNHLRANATAPDVVCNIYESFVDQAYTNSVPDTPKASAEIYKWIGNRIDPIFVELGCKPF
jgi:hypothetical protein